MRFAALGLTGLLTLVACGASKDSPVVSPAAQTPATTAATVPTASASAPTTTAATPTTVAATATKVAANTASRAELQQAFEAAGISNAARWAMEVEEYRPYPTNDPTFAKLRQNLAKYNPGPGVVDQIVATLAL
jgi:membrane-bound lytic murein transglycosylase B